MTVTRIVIPRYVWRCDKNHDHTTEEIANNCNQKTANAQNKSGAYKKRKKENIEIVRRILNGEGFAEISKKGNRTVHSITAAYRQILSDVRASRRKRGLDKRETYEEYRKSVYSAHRLADIRKVKNEWLIELKILEGEIK